MRIETRAEAAYPRGDSQQKGLRRMSREVVNTYEFSGLPDPFPAVAAEAARGILGVPVNVWMESGGWQLLIGGGDGFAPSFGPGAALEERFLDETWQRRPAVGCRALGGTEWLVGIPLEFEQARPLVAVACLDVSPQGVAQDLGRRFAEEVRRVCCASSAQVLLAAYSRQLTRDLEELTYLHRLAEHFGACELGRTPAEVAERLLPELRCILGAQSVAWVDTAQGLAPPASAASRAAVAAVRWAGPALLGLEQCAELVACLAPLDPPTPVVRNRPDQLPGAARLAGIRSLLLVPVEKGGAVFGWLMGLNRVPPAQASCPGAGRSVALSEHEFGTVEVGLARMAAAVLATHQRNRELFAAACQARQCAEAANRAKSRFLAGVSHEIRTPLNAILGYIDILAEATAGAAAATEPLQVIRRNAENLLHVVSAVLDLSKIEAEVVEVQRVPCAPLALAAEVEATLRIQAEAKGLAFGVERCGAVPELIYTDPLRLRQILLNLADNAVKFTAAGRVRLLVGSRDDESGQRWVTFAVVDTGIGMTEQQAATAFEPFVQFHDEQICPATGAGLGLAISRRLAELLGGRITVCTAPQAGCTFELSLPVGQPPEVPPAAPAASCRPAATGPGQGAEPPRLAGARILVAEDCLDNQRLVGHLLRKAGACVETAPTGQTAVELARKAQAEGRPFDLILMDIQMPGLDGLQATALLRAEGYRGAIVALTAYALADDRERCLRAGCDEYLTKPIRRDQLLEVVARFAPQAATPVGH